MRVAVAEIFLDQSGAPDRVVARVDTDDDSPLRCILKAVVPVIAGAIEDALARDAANDSFDIGEIDGQTPMVPVAKPRLSQPHLLPAAEIIRMPPIGDAEDLSFGFIARHGVTRLCCAAN